MKEKYDLSLDNRQIGSLLIGGIVVLGAVFVLGVVVGKKLATSDRAQGAPDLLSALDEKAAATSATSSAMDASLTFQEELTKKNDAPKPPPEPKRDAPKAVAVVPAGVEALPEEPKAAEPKPDGKVAPSPTVTRTADKDGGLREAIARATRPETAPNGAYTLQLSASQSREEADHFAARLREKGYAPFIVEADVPGRGTWYRVRMGSFASKDAAGRYLQDFKRETQMDAFVTEGKR